MAEQYTPPTMSRARELAFGGLFGAAGLVLPFLFHVLHLGHMFMPMYLPLMALPFFVGPVTAGTVGLLVPLVSAVTTGMPPFFPPVAPVMAVELGMMAAALAFLRSRFPAVPAVLHLVPVLLVGRAVNTVLLYLASLWMSLPAAFVAGISFISGWPGVVLMIVVLPGIASVRRMVDRRTHA